MSHRLTSLLILTAAPVLLAAPKPKDPPKVPAYFPTTVGDRWVFDDNGREKTREVTLVEVKGDETLVTVGAVIDGKRAEIEKVRVTPRGLYQELNSGYRVEPWCFLKHPAKAGDTWEVRFNPEAGPSPDTRKLTTGPIEDVEVPAGKFRAVRVTTELLSIEGQALPKPVVSEAWYAPDVGLVKRTEGSFHRVLKSFTPGKK